MTRNEFIAYLAPYAIQLRAEGSPMFPSVRLAQNALETGWKIPNWNNLGGIKVGSGRPNQWWDGSSVNKATWEVINGQRIDTAANFRAYESIYHFYKDQDLLFQLPRYERVRNAKTPEQQADALYACGYATDPQYAQKIKNIILMYDLKQYDKEAYVALEKIKELEQRVEELTKEVQALKEKQSMPSVPSWAQTAVEFYSSNDGKETNSKLVSDAQGGSYDFYRMLTIMYRAGVGR